MGLDPRQRAGRLEEGLDVIERPWSQTAVLRSIRLLGERVLPAIG